MLIPGGVADRLTGQPEDEADSARVRVIDYMPGAPPPPGALVLPRALWDDAVVPVDGSELCLVFPPRYVLRPVRRLTVTGPACSQTSHGEPAGSRPMDPVRQRDQLPPSGLGAATPPAAAPTRPPPRGLPGVRRTLFACDGDAPLCVDGSDAWATHGWAGSVEGGEVGQCGGCRGEQGGEGRGGPVRGGRGGSGFSGRRRRVPATDPQRQLAVRRGGAQGGDTARPTPPMGEG